MAESYQDVVGNRLNPFIGDVEQCSGTDTRELLQGQMRKKLY